MKVTNIILIVTSLIWTLINLYSAITSPNVVDLTSFIGIIPIFSGLYSEIDWIFITTNKLKAYLFLKTISFTPKSSRLIDKDTEISEIECYVKEHLLKNGYSIKEAFIKKTHEDFYFPLEKEGLSSKLTINLHKNLEGNRLVIKMEFQIAYRDVSKFWKEFILIRNEIFAHYSKTKDSKERYDVIIKTDKKQNYNPFYRLTVRHLGKTEVQAFNLKFKDEGLSVKTEINQIYGTSDNYQDIEKLIKECIPFSRLT